MMAGKTASDRNNDSVLKNSPSLILLVASWPRENGVSWATTENDTITLDCAKTLGTPRPQPYKEPP